MTKYIFDFLRLYVIISVGSLVTEYCIKEPSKRGGEMYGLYYSFSGCKVEKKGTFRFGGENK